MGDDEAIKRIRVVLRHCVDVEQMRDADRDKVNAVESEILVQEYIQGFTEDDTFMKIAIYTGLDRDLPRARDAEETTIVGIEDNTPRGRAKPNIIMAQVKERAGVEQYIHYR